MEADDKTIVTDPDVQSLVDAIPTETLLTVKQVAACIGGRSDDYVRQLCESGDLKVLGGRKDKSRQHILIYRSSVVRYIERNTK